MDFIGHLGRCLIRDIEGMVSELEAFPTEASVWHKTVGAPNSAGNLAAHVAGNLRGFIGAAIGNSGYVRDRPEEFSESGVSRAELIARLRSARDEVAATLAALDPVRLDDQFPLELGGMRFTNGQFLLHLATHTAYHLGQVDYCRRLSTGDVKGAGVGGLKPLAGS